MIAASCCCAFFNSSVALSYRTVRGNRIGGGGWDEADVPLGSYTTDADGGLRLTLPTPDDLEGDRLFTASAAGIDRHDNP